MELGPSHLQIIATVTLILTAAVVAFICDVLQRNNEQLRAMNIELMIRQEVNHKRSHLAPSKEKKRAINPEALAVIERGAAMAGSRKTHRSAPTAIRRDWGALLSRNAQGIKPVAPQLRIL
jgi:hypothetical protein